MYDMIDIGLDKRTLYERVNNIMKYTTYLIEVVKVGTSYGKVITLTLLAGKITLFESSLFTILLSDLDADKIALANSFIDKNLDLLIAIAEVNKSESVARDLTNLKSS